MTASTRLMWPRCFHQGFVKGIQLQGFRRLFTTDWAAAWQVSTQISTAHYQHITGASVRRSITQLPMSLAVLQSCCPHTYSERCARPESDRAAQNL